MQRVQMTSHCVFASLLTARVTGLILFMTGVLVVIVMASTCIGPILRTGVG